MVKGWTAVLKRARDTTAFGDDTVVATGSSWRADEDVEGHLLAGRAGTAGLRRVRQLLPMSFREYLATARPQLARPAPVHPADRSWRGWLRCCARDCLLRTSPR